MISIAAYYNAANYGSSKGDLERNSFINFNFHFF